MPASTHPTVAIMFTDMVGYQDLANHDESLARLLLEKQRSIIRQCSELDKGIDQGGNLGGEKGMGLKGWLTGAGTITRELKLAPSESLLTFSSPSVAIRCAVEIQRMLNDYNRKAPNEKDIYLKIGIHVGEPLGPDELPAQAVAIASRVAPLADLGGVCVTQHVLDRLVGTSSHKFEKLSETDSWGTQGPVEVYRVMLPWESGSEPAEGAAAAANPRLAVLPFASMSPDPNDEFFADGLTEEMITELSGVSGLGVIARTSVMRYKAAQKSVRDIAKDLGVGSVLEGSVRKAGNKIRITAQLINAKNEEHLWASKFDREMDDIFEVQSEIAQNIAKALQLKLLPTRAEATRPAENVEAYTLCMKARSFWNKRTKSGVEQAIHLFTDALEADPNSARAYAGLADCYDVGADWRYFDFKEAMAKARKFALRAVELDPNLPEAHAALGGMLHNDRSDYNRAEAEYKAAITLNPNYASARQWYYMLLMDLGREGEAEAEIKKALELDPLSPSILFHMGAFLWYTNRLAEAEAWVAKLIRTEPGFANGYAFRAWLLMLRGQKTGAMSDAEMFLNLTGDDPAYKVFKATLKALGGDIKEAQGLIEEVLPFIQASSSPVMGSPASFYAITGNRDEFFKWIEWAIENQGIRAADLRYDPIFLRMREDRRYQELFRRFNLSP